MQVIGGVRGADADKVGLALILAEGTGLGPLEGTHRLADLIHGEFVIGSQGGAGGLAAGPLHVVAGVHGVPGDPLYHGAQLLAQQLCALGDDLVVAGHIQQVGNLHIGAILADQGFHIALGEGLAAGGDAFLQGFHGGVGIKEIPAAEFHPLAAIAGDGAHLAKLGVDKAGAGALQELTVVKGFVELGGL